MRIITSGDWQCSLQNLDRCEILVKQVVNLLKESRKNHNTFFVHLGDVKETMNPVDQRVTNFLIRSFEEIKQNCTAFYYVKGNHDAITTQDGVPSCVPLISALGASAVADDSWVKVPIRLLTWNPRVVRYVLLYMVPYVRDNAVQKKMFQEAAIDAALPLYVDPSSDAVGEDNIKILFFHNTVTGCRQNLYTKGDGISVEDLGAKYYDMCVGGHIHLPQIIKPNIYYAGSPFPMTWGEVNYDHRILQLTIDEKSK